MKFYLEQNLDITGIVLVENSGYNLNAFKKVPNPHNYKLEFISTNCFYPKSVNKISFRKAYGEMFEIDTAISQSSIISDADYVIKVTGRIRLLNFIQLLSTIKWNWDFYCDLKDQSWLFHRLQDKKSAKPYCDTRVIIFTKEFYQKYLSDVMTIIERKKIILERAIYEVITKGRTIDLVQKRFPIMPCFGGYSGSFKGVSYDGNRVSIFLKKILRRIMPWIHF